MRKSGETKKKFTKKMCEQMNGTNEWNILLTNNLSAQSEMSNDEYVHRTKKGICISSGKRSHKTKN